MASYEWIPSYETWRHGGWYVTNVRYPSGACGCVSNNFSDRKWRIVAENTGPGAEGDVTFPSRDAAARAEYIRAGMARRAADDKPLYQVTRSAIEEMAGRKVSDEEIARISSSIEFSTVKDAVRDAVAMVIDLPGDEEDGGENFWTPTPADWADDGTGGES